MKPIFIAGPHGSGKTTLISKLIVKSDRFIKDDYEIDFSNDMETLSSMTIFEKCLIRLYHRFYTAELAIKKCGMSKENDKILVVDRSIYDSLVYIEVEYKLGELSDEQYHKLREIVDNSLAMIEPYTVVLNPNPEEIVRRLEIRRATGTRKKRDQMCAREDNVDYVGKMNDEFIKIYSNKNVININNNEDEDIKKIRYMVRCLPDGVMPILIIENKLSVEDIMKVINIYGLNVFKCGIQMQFRTNIEYINKIIEMGFERVIVAVGLMQKDVKEYLEFVDKALRTSKDLILLDMSRHQPHVIVNEKVIDKYDVSFETKYNCLNRIVSCLKKLETSVLLADDIMPDKMILCQLMLLSQGVNIIGLDMQNNIEVDKTEQKYCKIKENKTSKYHYAKIRKSVEKIKKWNIFE